MKWGQDYRSFRRRAEDPAYKAHFTYLNYEARIQSKIYTTNWIECLQKDFRRVTRMRGAMPSEKSVLFLMGKTAMDKKSYLRPEYAAACCSKPRIAIFAYLKNLKAPAQTHFLKHYHKFMKKRILIYSSD